MTVCRFPSSDRASYRIVVAIEHFDNHWDTMFGDTNLNGRIGIGAG
jgi:hypothetical protein